MAKIVIFEDNRSDFNFRYGELIGQHEVIVYALGIFSVEHERYMQNARTAFEQGKYTRKQYDDLLNAKKHIHLGIPKEIPEADFYFTDGLDGECFSLLNRLPRDRSYLLSGDPNIREAAISSNFNTIEDVLEVLT